MVSALLKMKSLWSGYLPQICCTEAARHRSLSLTPSALCPLLPGENLLSFNRPCKLVSSKDAPDHFLIHGHWLQLPWSPQSCPLRALLSVTIGLLGLLQCLSSQQTCLPMQETQETWVQPLGWEDPLEEEMATHSSSLAWRIPRTEKPGGLQSVGSQIVRFDSACTCTHRVIGLQACLT